MKYFCFKYLNTIFVILLIQLYCSKSLSLVKRKETDNNNNNSTQIKLSVDVKSCKVIQVEEDRDQIIQHIIEISKNDKKHSNKFYLIFFSNRIENFNEMKHFANNLNIFFEDLIQFRFYCFNKTIGDRLNLSSRNDDIVDSKEHYVIQHGNILEKKKIKNLSKGYLNYLLKRFNVTDYINHKVNQIKSRNELIVNQIQLFIHNSNKIVEKRTRSFLELNSKIEYNLKIETNKTSPEFPQMSVHSNSIKHVNKNGYMMLIDETTSRLTRFIWAILIVLFFNGACFTIVKFSVEWATSSQTELNKIKTNQIETLTRQIKYNSNSYVINRELRN